MRNIGKIMVQLLLRVDVANEQIMINDMDAGCSKKLGKKDLTH